MDKWTCCDSTVRVMHAHRVVKRAKNLSVGICGGNCFSCVKAVALTQTLMCHATFVSSYIAGTEVRKFKIKIHVVGVSTPAPLSLQSCTTSISLRVCQWRSQESEPALASMRPMRPHRAAKFRGPPNS